LQARHRVKCFLAGSAFDTARFAVAFKATSPSFYQSLFQMSKLQNNTAELANEFVYTLSKREIQMFAEHFQNRELTLSEMESFENRFEKHICTEYVVSAIEDCLSEILE
jgi:aspartate aminotransferase-like enzyme